MMRGKKKGITRRHEIDKAGGTSPEGRPQRGGVGNHELRCTASMATPAQMSLSGHRSLGDARGNKPKIKSLIHRKGKCQGAPVKLESGIPIETTKGDLGGSKPATNKKSERDPIARGRDKVLIGKGERVPWKS